MDLSFCHFYSQRSVCIWEHFFFSNSRSASAAHHTLFTHHVNPPCSVVFPRNTRFILSHCRAGVLLLPLTALVRSLSFFCFRFVCGFVFPPTRIPVFPAKGGSVVWREVQDRRGGGFSALLFCFVVVLFCCFVVLWRRARFESFPRSECVKPASNHRFAVKVCFDSEQF